MKDAEEHETATPKEVAVSPFPIAVYDACVLYPEFIRDVLLRIGVANIVACRWTDEIQDEWSRNLLANRPDIGSTKILALRSAMERALPLARVDNYQRHASGLPIDPKDRHVLAAAIEARASFIVTSNLSHFPQADLARYGVQPISPDDFLVQLHSEDAETLVRTLNRHRRGLTNPVLSPSEYIERCRHNGLTNFSPLLTADARL